VRACATTWADGGNGREGGGVDQPSREDVSRQVGGGGDACRFAVVVSSECREKYAPKCCVTTKTYEDWAYFNMHCLLCLHVDGPGPGRGFEEKARS
jgi:hypothetical protein